MNMKEEMERLKMNLDDAKEKIKPNLQDLKDQVVSNVQDVKDKVMPNVEDLKDQVKSHYENAKENVKANIEGAKEQVKSSFEHVKENVKSNIEGAKEEVQNVLTDFQHELNGIFITMIGVMSVYLNAKLIYRILSQHRREWLIINLAIANLCLTLMVYPFSAYSSFVHQWAFGDTTCKYYGFLGLLFGFAMMTTVPMIAIDEYLAFDWPPYITKREKFQKWMIAYSWVNTLFWSVTPLVGWSRISYEEFGTSCTVVYHPNEGYASYILLTFFFCYILPIITLYICKTRYGTHLIQLSKTTKSALTLSSRTMMLMFAFLVCWSPYALIYLWPILNERRVGSVAITALGPLFAKLSTVVTPLILLYYTDNATPKVE